MNARETSPSARVFISHSHKDRAVATEIQRVLERSGGKTYLDQDKVQVGDVLPDRINQGIDWCNAFVLVWSSNAAASDWVGREWNSAYDLRRKIIPYCLDSTSLPSALENLVYVDSKDAQVAHAGLLRAVFGRDFTPASTEVFPGHWRLKLNAFGLGTATYDLELRANGQITGFAKLDEGGVITGLIQSVGASVLQNLQARISGTWEYEDHTEILTLDLIAYGLGQEFRETIQIKTTGREVGEIQGLDLAGRTYAMRRLAGSRLQESLIQLEKTLAAFATATLTPATIEQQVNSVLAAIDAVAEHRDSVVKLSNVELRAQFARVRNSPSVFREQLASECEFSEKARVMQSTAALMATVTVPALFSQLTRGQ